ncbi:PfkB family carbohydrate kinase [Caballeronia sp. 15715]|uniref:PfkB family carbohydrate kinase n=1 Tax=Caballeronia sp. 15715 TaxID=3391030 RepID=UPI0039E67765
MLALDVLLGEGKSSLRAELGGSAGNVLAILAFLGWSSVPVARLGDDVAGKRIRREFEVLRADTRFLKHEHQAHTPVVYQSPGDRDCTHKFSFSCPFCGLKRGFAAEDGDAHCHTVLRQIERPDVFYFDRVTDGSLSLAESYRRRGALVVFEPSAVATDTADFQRAIDACHVLKYADERIAELAAFDCSSVEVVIQTLGAQGLRFRVASEMPAGSWRTLAAFKVPHIRDTAGAGDWCTAGLLYALHDARSSPELRTSTVAASLRFGQALAALNCMHLGARGLARFEPRDKLQALAALMKGPDPVEVLETEGWRDACESAHAFPVPHSGVGSHISSVQPAKLCCELFPV